MVASKDSWKWKALVAFIVLFIGTFAFVFTEYGRLTMMGWLTNAYDECPPEERKTQKAADYWLTLSWFEGNIKSNNKQSVEMYWEFLGILEPDPEHHKSFFALKEETGVAKWKGKFDKVSKTGWGILHERAPEAYLDMMKLWEQSQSLTYIGEYARGYYVLFFKLYPSISGTHRPHPMAYKYWGKIKIMLNKYKVPIPTDIPKKPPEFPDEEQ